MTTRTLTARRPCPVHKTHHTVEALADDVDRYLAGELIQRAFPEMPAGTREILMSGICPEAWEALGLDDEDDDLDEGDEV